MQLGITNVSSLHRAFLSESLVGPLKNSMTFRCHRPAQTFSHVSTKSTFLRNIGSQKKSPLQYEDAKVLMKQFSAAGRQRTSSYLRHSLLVPIVAAIIFALIGSVQGGIDAQNTLSCHRRQYRYKITETDASGRACWDYVNVMSCWGRCESHEIADWKFPYKRSHHPVCQHAGTKESEVILRNCDPGVAPGTEIHKFTEAAVCACSLCKSSETSCEGLRFRGVRRAPRDAGPVGGRGPAAGHGKVGDSEVAGVVKRGRNAHQKSEVSGAGQSSDAATRRSLRETSALMVARHANFGGKFDRALTKSNVKSGYGNFEGDGSAQKLKGKFDHVSDETYGKRNFEDSFANVHLVGAPLFSSSGAAVKKDLENFVEIPVERDQVVPYPDYDEGDHDEEGFFYVDAGTRGVPIGATGKGVISSGSDVQRQREDEEIPLKSFEEAAAAAKLLMLRKQLSERDDERRPSLKDVVSMISNYRKLDQFVVPPESRLGGNFLLTDFVVERKTPDA